MAGSYQEQSLSALFVPLDNQVQELLQVLSFLTEEQINTVPFSGSWTAAQTARHILKSNASIGQALHLPGQRTTREPDQRVPELRDLFLDFTTKFDAAPFIRPKQEKYGKNRLVIDLKGSAASLKEASAQVDLDEAIHHPAFGEITKLELLYFVRFHTQRHVRQVKNIVARLQALK